MNPEVPLQRNPGFGEMPSFPMLLNPAANLFSTIAIPAFQSGGGAGTGSDSGGDGSNMDKDGRGGGKNKASIQEKNRRAQKRFRERQKAKMKDMTEHLEDLSSELSKLRMENNALKNRNSVLEKVLTLRDEHIRVMQDEQHVFDLGNPYLQNINSQKMLTGNNNNTEVALPTTSTEMMALDVKAIKTMPADVVINCWKDTVRDLGNILVEIEGCSDKNSKEFQDGMDHLCRILDTAVRFCLYPMYTQDFNSYQKLLFIYGYIYISVYCRVRCV